MVGLIILCFITFLFAVYFYDETLRLRSENADLRAMLDYRKK